MAIDPTKIIYSSGTFAVTLNFPPSKGMININ